MPFPSRAAQPQSALRAEVKTSDEVELATLRGKVAFFEEENRKLKVQIIKVQKQTAHDAAASARADAEKLRGLFKHKDDELKKVRKELGERRRTTRRPNWSASGSGWRWRSTPSAGATWRGCSVRSGSWSTAWRCAAP